MSFEQERQKDRTAASVCSGGKYKKRTQSLAVIELFMERFSAPTIFPNGR